MARNIRVRTKYQGPRDGKSGLTIGSRIIVKWEGRQRTIPYDLAYSGDNHAKAISQAIPGAIVGEPEYDHRRDGYDPARIYTVTVPE